jgi:hypothetical protein
VTNYIPSGFTLAPETSGAGGGGGTSGEIFGAAPNRAGGGGGSSLFGEIAHDVTHNFVTHLVGKTVTGEVHDLLDTPAGIETLVKGLFTRPIPTLEAVGESFYKPFLHPLRAPDQTLNDALSLLPIPGMGLGRIIEIGSILDRAGALPAELADAAKIEESGLSPQAYAESLGKGDAYSRAMRGSEPKSVSEQVLQTLLHGPPQEERLLKTGTGELKHGLQYSKDPTIRAIQKQIDKLYDRFPDGKPPPVMRLIPGFTRSQAGRLNQAAKAAQTIERNILKGHGNAFLKKWQGKLDPDMELAARLVGELRDADGSINLHEAELRAGKADVNVPETNEQIASLKRLQDKGLIKTKMVRLKSGRTFPISVLGDKAPEFLDEYIQDARKLSDMQQSALSETGVLPEESLLNRLLAPFHQVNFGGKLPPSIAKLEKRLNVLRNLKGTEEERAKVEAQLADRRKQWEDSREEPPPGAGAEEAVQEAEKLKPSRAEQTLEDELTRLRAEGASGASERAREIQAHIDRIRRNEGLGENLEEVPHDMTVAEMKELREIAKPFYVPYKIHRQGLSSFGMTAFRRAFKFTGKPTLPGRITHAVGGHEIEGDARTLLKLGGGRTDVTRLLAENYAEGIRYTAMMKHYRDILASAQDTPEGIPEGHARLIRDLTTLKAGQLPYEKAEAYSKIANDLLNGGIKEGDEQAHGALFEGIRNWIFPDKGKIVNAEDEYRPVPGYKWVDDRTLGYLDKQNPIFSALRSKNVRAVVKTADAINTIQKTMVLYLKPAFAVPNAFGNLFLNAVQQGVWAPINLARSFKIFNHLKPETIEKMDQSMGGGFSELLKPTGIAGRVHRVSNAFASGYGRVVDVPFRRASFLHEARLSGFTTPEDIERLLNDPTQAATLTRVASRANEEILNYDRMGPGEQAILRRLVFFYPWLKASTRYVSYAAKNHPFAAGLSGYTGQTGQKQIANVLGDLPSFEEGLIPITGAHGPFWARTALTSNPSSFTPIAEPAEIAEMLMNVVRGHPNLNLDAFQNLAPIDRGLLALGTAGKISTLKHSPSQTILRTALNEVFGGNPAFGNTGSFLEHMTGGKTYPGSIYPYNDRLTALLRFLLTGALTPTLTNINTLNADAKKQTSSTEYVGG